MREVLRRWAYLAATVCTLAAVWVAAKHPPEPEPLFITTDGRVCDRPPPGARWSREATDIAEDDAVVPESPVAAVTR